MHFGRVETQVNDLTVNDQGILGLSAAWRLSEGRGVERWTRDASFPWRLYSSKWLRSDCGVPCLAHCSFPYQFSLPSIQSELFLWQLLSLGQQWRNQRSSSFFRLLNKNSVRWIRPRVLWSVCFVALFAQPRSPLLLSWPLHWQGLLKKN